MTNLFGKNLLCMVRYSSFYLGDKDVWMKTRKKWFKNGFTDILHLLDQSKFKHLPGMSEVLHFASIR